MRHAAAGRSVGKAYTRAGGDARGESPPKAMDENLAARDVGISQDVERACALRQGGKEAASDESRKRSGEARGSRVPPPACS